ncbi:MAG: exodeoxyribonuclease VII small subunit, partial [Clostridia bacterium]|nr:exodeoxyribonuclease VII small subunit [Clostridia bacterium]
MSEKQNNLNEKSFEENMERLKEIVSALEGGKETLENSI